jgi:hypothetical protein
MTVLFPNATKAQGNVSVTVVASIASLTAPSLATEINAAGSVNVSCHLFDNGAICTASTNKVTAPPRLCTTEQLQSLGNTTFEVSDLSYVYDPQAAGSTLENKAKTLLVEGSTVYLVERLGLIASGTAEVAYAVSQKVNIYKVTLGKQNRTRQGDAESAVFSITQSAVLLAPPTYESTIAA